MKKAFLKLKQDKYFQKTLLIATLAGLASALLRTPVSLPMALVMFYRLKTRPSQKKSRT